MSSKQHLSRKFRPGPAFRVANRLMVRLLKWGFPVGVRRAPMALITVVGRKSGLPRSVPISLVSEGRGWLLVAVYGVSDWSRNLEEVGQASLSMRGRSTSVTATRLPPTEAGPLLRDLLLSAPWLVRRLTSRYFNTGPESDQEEWERESKAHPVFRLTPAWSPAQSEQTHS